MDENEEIKNDLEALNEYLKKDSSEDAYKKFIEVFVKKGYPYPEYIAKLLKDETNFKENNYRTPARVNREKGIIEVSKKHFFPDKASPEYHRFKINSFRITVFIDVYQFELNNSKNKLTKKEIRQWFDYVDKALDDYDAAKKFLKKKGEDIRTDWYAYAYVAHFKIWLLKKYWWRMGLFGIKKRIEYNKLIKTCKGNIRNETT